MKEDDMDLKKWQDEKLRRIRFHKTAKIFIYIGLGLLIISIILFCSFYGNVGNGIMMFLVAIVTAVGLIFVLLFFGMDFGYKKDIIRYDAKILEAERLLEDKRKYTLSQDVLKKVGIIDVLSLGSKNIGYGNRSLYIWNRQYIDLTEYYNIDNDEYQKKDLMSKLQSVAIHEEDIVFYKKEGDVQYTTEVSGGGGGGSSISGAIVGGIIAGGAGAIIGSRKEVNEISSKTITHDSRFTLLRYKKRASAAELKFPTYAVYDFLLRYFPEKDLLYLQMSNNNNFQNKQIEDNLETKLLALKNIYEKGLINEDEYNVKKKQLLDSI